MAYVIKGTDTSGVVTLKRDTVPGALKKATELSADGCLNVQIELPDGQVVDAQAFDSLRAQSAAGVA